ncbi:MAG: hypothetical protein IH898_03755 [Planctomycetes bacterium]|nr:hypothetical protein [Planctomycetota bacterium]
MNGHRGHAIVARLAGPGEDAGAGVSSARPFHSHRRFRELPEITRVDCRNIVIAHECADRELIRLAPWRGSYALNKVAFNGRWKSFQQAGQLLAQCQTSHLLSQELSLSGRLFELLHGWVDDETRRRALLVQLALLAYRLDHGEYPETLAQLTPDYLPEAVLDPFSGENFRYRAEGFELPITRKYHYQDEEIPAGTPLLWSVGNANSELREEQEQERQEQESGRTVLRFRLTETVGHYYYRNQVFTLPK